MPSTSNSQVNQIKICALENNGEAFLVKCVYLICLIIRVYQFDKYNGASKQIIGPE